MTDSGAAFDPNRLPWLTDTPQPSRKHGWAPVLSWGVLAMVLVALVGYWAGLTSSAPNLEETPIAPASPIVAPRQESPSQPSAVASPTAPALEPTPEAEPLPPPMMQAPALQREVQPSASDKQAEAPAVVAADGPETTGDASAKNDVATAAAETSATAALPDTTPAVVPRAPSTRSATALWPADQSENAHGRLVRIGTFSSRLQAKRAWWRIVKVYPGMRRLKATVVANPSLRNGRTYYRLQFGTSSQAHSAVLCQRMRIVGQSCVVIGVGGA